MFFDAGTKCHRVYQFPFHFFPLLSLSLSPSFSDLIFHEGISPAGFRNNPVVSTNKQSVTVDPSLLPPDPPTSSPPSYQGEGEAPPCRPKINILTEIFTFAWRLRVANHLKQKQKSVTFTRKQNSDQLSVTHDRTLSETSLTKTTSA